MARMIKSSRSTKWLIVALLVIIPTVFMFVFSSSGYAAIKTGWPQFTGFFSGYKLVSDTGPNVCTWRNSSNNKTCLPSQQSDNHVMAEEYYSSRYKMNMAIPDSIDTANELTDFLKSKNQNNDATTRRKTGSGFIARTMLGKTGNRTISNADWEEIRSRLNYAKITWFGKATSYNSTMSIFLDGPNYADVMWCHGSCSNINAAAIIITSPNGNQYVLFRRCANPSGESKALQPAPKEWDLYGSSWVYGGQATAQEGDQVTFRHNITNPGDDNMTENPKSRIWYRNPNTNGNWEWAEPIVTPHDKIKVGNSTKIRNNTMVMDAGPGQYCQKIRYTWDTQNGGISESPETCVTVGASTSYNPTTAGDDYEKGSGNTYNVTFGINIGSANCSPMTIEWQASGPGMDPVSFTSHVNESCAVDSGDALSQTIHIPDSNDQDFKPDEKPVGGYAYTTTVNSPTPDSSTDDVAIYEVPYARFYGNDMHATNGKVFFNYKNNESGSASQYAVIASDLISSVTATYRLIPPDPPVGLAVSDFVWRSVNERNLSDYLPISSTTYSSRTDLYSLGEGYYETKGDIEIPGSSSEIEKKITIRAKDNGSLYIYENITNKGPQNPFSDSTTPVVLLIADNDIYIHKDVTRIDAILIAGGTIYTCANGINEEVARNNWDDEGIGCRTKLTVNGALGASDIRFARSIGTRLLGQSLENSSLAGKGNMFASTGGLNQAAEVINFPGYLYFATPELNDMGKAGFQAMFNAAPLL